jgi:hypothetical protein
MTEREAHPAPQGGDARDRVDYKIGSWLSAALEDPSVCAEMKADINAWFEAHQPGLIMAAPPAPMPAAAAYSAALDQWDNRQCADCGYPVGDKPVFLGGVWFCATCNPAISLD